MLTRNKWLAGAAALAALSLVAPAHAQGQGPIKLGELNSYKVFPAFLDPTRRASSWRSRRLTARVACWGARSRS